MRKNIFLVLFLAFLLPRYGISPTTANKLTATDSLLQLLINELPDSSKYVEFEYTIEKENSEWMKGTLLSYLTESSTELPPDVRTFIGKKGPDNIVNTIAFRYSELLNTWLPSISEDIIPVQERKYWDNIKSYTKEQNLSNNSDPLLSFPWRTLESWRFNSGPHSYAGPDYPTYTWSGIDFGLPLRSTNRIVLAGKDGIVLAVDDKDTKCWVIITNEDGWGTRYLHLDNIIVNKDDIISRGQAIGTVDLSEPCFDADGPHLHMDLMQGENYFPIDKQFIGGWKIVSTGRHYNGYLEMEGIRIPADVDYPIQAQIFNTGNIGSDNYPYPPSKVDGGITICDNGRCFVVPEGAEILPGKLSVLDRVLSWIGGLSLHFWSSGSNLRAQTNFACVDFDVSDLSEYYFPGTALNLLQNATEARVVQGNCNPADRATKSTGEGNGFSNEDVVIPLYCNETDNTWFTLYGDGICYSPSLMFFQPYTLPFKPVRVKVGTEFTRQLFLLDQEGHCDSFTAGMDVLIPPDRVYIRGALIGPVPRPDCNILPINDVPFVYAVMENQKNIDPPLIVWKTSDVNPQTTLSVVIELRRSGTLLKQFELPPGVNQWQPDVYDPGNYTVSITTKGGSYQPGPSSTQGFTLVDGPDWYQGWDEQDSYFAGDTKRTQRFTIAAGGVVDIWGSNILVNGVPITTTLARSMTTMGAAKTIYRLGAGEYNLEWSNGLAYQGADDGSGHHLWLAEKNAAVYGGTWNTLDLRNPSELPTLTPTNTPTLTNTPTPSMTPTANSSATSTPIVSITPTPTKIDNPTPVDTPTVTPTVISTLTPTASATILPAPSATPTTEIAATATASPIATNDPLDDQPLRLFLPLVTR